MGRAAAIRSRFSLTLWPILSTTRRSKEVPLSGGGEPQPCHLSLPSILRCPTRHPAALPLGAQHQRVPALSLHPALRCRLVPALSWRLKKWVVPRVWDWKSAHPPPPRRVGGPGGGGGGVQNECAAVAMIGKTALLAMFDQYGSDDGQQHVSRGYRSNAIHSRVWAPMRGVIMRHCGWFRRLGDSDALDSLDRAFNWNTVQALYLK